MDWSNLTPYAVVVFVALLVWEIAKGILGNLLTDPAKSALQRLRDLIRDRIAQRNLTSAAKQITGMGTELAHLEHLAATC